MVLYMLWGPYHVPEPETGVPQVLLGWQWPRCRAAKALRQAVRPIPPCQTRVRVGCHDLDVHCMH